MAQLGLDPAKLVFIDETWAKTNMLWGPRGQRLRGQAPYGHWQTLTSLAARHDQIDALSTLHTNPMKYLVAPRLLAGIIALPLLVVIADILGVMGGFIVSTLKLGFNVSGYLANTISFVQMDDVVSGLVKAAGKRSAKSSRSAFT